MSRKIQNFVFAIAAAFSLLGCSYKVEKEKEEPFKLGSAMSFAEVQALALGPKCARCHGWVASYERTAALAADISGRVQSNSAGFQMPPASASQLSNNEKAIILSWVAAGAQKEPGQPKPPVTPPIEPPPGTFAFVKFKVLDGKCMRCHDKELDTYEHTRPLLKEIEFRVLDIGGDSQMPPAKKTQLTVEEKNILLSWIRNGAKE